MDNISFSWDEKSYDIAHKKFYAWYDSWWMKLLRKVWPSKFDLGDDEIDGLVAGKIRDMRDSIPAPHGVYIARKVGIYARQKLRMLDVLPHWEEFELRQEDVDYCLWCAAAKDQHHGN